MIAFLCVLTLVFSLIAVVLSPPVNLGFSIYAMMFWALSWVGVWYEKSKQRRKLNL